MILPLLLLAAQVTPVAPLPKGNALPMEATDVRAVMVPIDGIFQALAARNGALILPHVTAQGAATVATEQPDGTRTVRQMSWQDFAAAIKPGPERYEEQLRNPAIEVDGDIAMVWGDYDFRIDGKIHHCGVDHFGLVREAGVWKISSIAWSSRTKGCE
jgi:hypothetical protein